MHQPLILVQDNLHCLLSLALLVYIDAKVITWPPEPVRISIAMQLIRNT